MKRRETWHSVLVYLITLALVLLTGEAAGEGDDLSIETVSALPYVVDFGDDIAIRCLPDGSIEATVEAYDEAEWKYFEAEGDTWATHYSDEEYRAIMDAYESVDCFQRMQTAGDYIDVSAQCYGTLAAVHADGTVEFNKRAEKRFYAYSDDEKWQDIKRISLGSYAILALKNDGTVVTHGEESRFSTGVHPSQWKDVVAIDYDDVALGLRADGRVYYSDSGYNPSNPDYIGPEDTTGYVNLDTILEWTDIVQVANRWGNVVGLKKDGTVVFAGYERGGNSKVAAWTDIVKIAVGEEYIVGLRRDGTLISTKDWALESVDGLEDGTNLNNVVDVYANRFYTLAVLEDGSCRLLGKASEWPSHDGAWPAGDWVFPMERIEDQAISGVEDDSDRESGAYGFSGNGVYSTIASGNGHVVAIREDGTVVALGENDDGQCDVEGWKDIIQVAAGLQHTVALQADGRVVATGKNTFGQTEVDDWRNIIQIGAGYHYTAGLCADGHVVFAGNGQIDYSEVEAWQDIVKIVCGPAHIVGLKKDGTVVAAGDNSEGQCAVDSWHDIVNVVCGGQYTIGIMEDESIVVEGEGVNWFQSELSKWKDVCLLSSGYSAVAAVMRDGTVEFTGWGDYRLSQYSYDESSWTDIVDVAIGTNQYVGLRSDGSLAVAYSLYGMDSAYALYYEDRQWIGDGLTGVRVNSQASDNSVSAFSVIARGNEEYELSSSGIINKYRGQDTDLVIPNQIGEQTVTGIGSYVYALNRLRDNVPVLERVAIPAAVKVIQECAFLNQDDLVQIEFSEGLETIQREAFQECSALKEIRLPSTVRTLEKDAFNCCTQLEHVELNEGLVTLDAAFTECWRLKTLTIPSTVLNLGGTILAGSGIECVYFLGQCPQSYYDTTFSDYSKGAYHDFENLTIYYPSEFADSYAQIIEWHPNVHWIEKSLAEIQELSSTGQYESSELAEQENEPLAYDKIIRIFRFHNGLAAVWYQKDNRNYVDYIDEQGNVAFTDSLDAFYWMSDSAPIANGKSCFIRRELSPNGYTLYDSTGRELLSIPDKVIISAPSEGLFYVDNCSEIMKNRSIIYYDEAGSEVLKLSGYASLGLASQFTDGRAIVCRISDEEELNAFSMGKGYPTDWTMVDIYGHTKRLRVMNPEIIFDAAVRRRLENEKHFDFEENSYTFEDYRISAVSAFQPGEAYASVKVCFKYLSEDKTWGSTSKGTFEVLGKLDKQGNIYLTKYIVQGIAPCINNRVLLQNNTDVVIVDFAADTMTRLSELPIYRTVIDEDALYNTPYVVAYLMTDGNYFVKMNHAKDNSQSIAVIMSSDGTICEGPVSLDPDIDVIYDETMVWPMDTLHQIEFRGSSYDWQRSISRSPTILSRNRLYPAHMSVNSPSINSYLDEHNLDRALGYVDIWEKPVIEAQYMEATQFCGGKALVCSSGTEYLSYGFTTDLSVISQLDEGDDTEASILVHYACEPLEEEYSVQAINEAVLTLMEASRAYQSATNTALLPTGVGESLGYLYDIATFDVAGLVKHVISDAVHEYRKEAAGVIMRSLLGRIDIEEYCINHEALKDFAQSPEFLNFKESQGRISKLNSYLEKMDPDSDAIWYTKGGMSLINNLLKGITSLGKYIDELEVSTEDKLVILLLVSNYQSNVSYIEGCIESSRTSNPEMAEIYRTVLKELNSTYQDYIVDAANQIKGRELFHMFFNDETIDNVNWILDANDISASKGIKNFILAGMEKSGLSKEAATNRVNAYFIVHSLAVKCAEMAGTDDTYGAMQKLYENGIVVNAMVSELSSGIDQGMMLSDRVQRALALGEYKLVVLDNLQTFYNVCWSARGPLTPETIGSERMRILSTIKWLQEGMDNWLKMPGGDNTSIAEKAPSVPEGSASNDGNYELSNGSVVWNDHVYRVIDESLTWQQAKEKCEEAGGHLVTITSPEEQVAVETMLSEAGEKSLYWIGLIKADDVPTWISGEPFEYANWNEGEPSSFSEPYGDIYRVDNPYGNAFAWNDSADAGNGSSFHSMENHGYICEWEKGTQDDCAYAAPYVSGSDIVAYNVESIYTVHANGAVKYIEYRNGKANGEYAAQKDTTEIPLIFMSEGRFLLQFSAVYADGTESEKSEKLIVTVADRVQPEKPLVQLDSEVVYVGEAAHFSVQATPGAVLRMYQNKQLVTAFNQTISVNGTLQFDYIFNNPSRLLLQFSTVVNGVESELSDKITLSVQAAY